MSGKCKRAAVALCLAAALCLSGCLGGTGGAGGGGVSRPERVESAELQFTHPASGDTVAVFDTSMGVFRAVLYPEEAPQACANFIGLVQAGYYNGLTVSRVEAGFVVGAGRDANGGTTTIWNGSGYPHKSPLIIHSIVSLSVCFFPHCSARQWYMPDCRKA